MTRLGVPFGPGAVWSVTAPGRPLGRDSDAPFLSRPIGALARYSLLASDLKRFRSRMRIGRRPGRAARRRASASRPNAVQAGRGSARRTARGAGAGRRYRLSAQMTPASVVAGVFSLSLEALKKRGTPPIARRSPPGAAAATPCVTRRVTARQNVNLNVIHIQALVRLSRCLDN